MKYLFLILLAINPVSYIAEINRTQIKAEEAFLQKDYASVIQYYAYLADTLNVKKEKIWLNLAHAYFKNKNPDKAAFYYDKAKNMAEKKSHQSIACSQLGYIAEIDQNNEMALAYFKQAIKRNPSNVEARYNYELIKKRIHILQKKEGKKNRKNTANKRVSKQQDHKVTNMLLEEQEEGKNMLRKKAKQENGENGHYLQPEKLQQIKLNREKAEAILKALLNQEIQYIQQIKRIKNTTLYKGNSTKDW